MTKLITKQSGHNRLLTLFLLVSVPAAAQVETRRINPENFDGHIRHHAEFKARKVTMQPVDVARLLAEDKREAGLPPRFGKALQVNLGLEDGSWEENSLGRIWKLKIHSPGAFSINLKFDPFFLPDSAELYIYNEDRTMIMGPVTSNLNKQNKGFATDLIQGSTVILELFEPASHFGETKLGISRVVHGYKNMFGGEFAGPGFGYSAPCHNDVNCPEGNGWEDEYTSVGMVLVNGVRHCSGAMINNACQDFTPNFLTAFHCLDLNRNLIIDAAERTAIENDWVFRFQYLSPSCNGQDDTHFFSFNGSTFRAASEPTDYVLVELDNLPAGETGITLAGWNRGGAAATSSVGIHHPRGDVMKISVENNAATPVAWFGGANDHWRVRFDDGTVEFGSSGSPLFDQNHRIVGQLHGDQGNTCASIDNNNCFCNRRFGEYGMLGVSWNAGLRPWLTNDPNVVTTNTIRIPFIVESADVVVCTTNKSFSFANAPPSGSHNVSWSTTANLTVVSSNQSSVTVRYSGSGNGIGTITATVSNNNTGLCPVTRTFSENVQAGPFTTSQVTVSGTVGVCQGTVYTYTANVPFGHKSGYTYNWTWPSNWFFVSQGANTIRLQTPSVATPDGGTVRVNVNNGCGWSGLTGLTVFPICGGFSAKAKQEPELFNQYPNPSSGTLTIERGGPEVEVGPYLVELHNYFGEKVTTLTTSDRKINLSTSHLPPGHYILKIIYKEGILTRRIAVE